MNKEQQRIALAEFCGWKRFDPPQRGYAWWKDNHKGKMEPPDYPDDLNAIHEPEEVLLERDSDEFEKYLSELVEVVNLQGGYYICATAPQRAEAILRTIGKWEEAKN